MPFSLAAWKARPNYAGEKMVALGSWSGGLIHDFTHSYNLLLLFALASVILGMIPFLVVPALRE